LAKLIFIAFGLCLLVFGLSFIRIRLNSHLSILAKFGGLGLLPILIWFNLFFEFDRELILAWAFRVCCA